MVELYTDVHFLVSIKTKLIVFYLYSVITNSGNNILPGWSFIEIDLHFSTSGSNTKSSGQNTYYYLKSL